MTSSSPISLLLLSLSSLLLISPSSAAATCPTLKFKSNKIFANCTVLSSLSSHLYYSYNASNSSLSVAFVAKPSKPGGWIAWAINPTATKMAGAQAIVAYTKPDGTPTIKTLNITSYSSLTPGKLAFDFWDAAAELKNGTLAVFVTVKVPEKAETVNQVWQVGPGVNATTGYLEKHDFGTENLAAYGPLSLTGDSSSAASSNTTAPAPAPAPTTTTTTTTTNTTTGGSGSNSTSGAELRIGDGGHVGLLLSLLALVFGVVIVF